MLTDMMIRDIATKRKAEDRAEYGSDTKRIKSSSSPTPDLAPPVRDPAKAVPFPEKVQKSQANLRGPPILKYYLLTLTACRNRRTQWRD